MVLRMQIKIKICASVLLELMYFIPNCKKIKNRAGGGVKQREGKKRREKEKNKMGVLQERGPLPGLESGLLSNTRK